MGAGNRNSTLAILNTNLISQMSFCYVSGTVLGIEDTMVSKTRNMGWSLAQWSTYLPTDLSTRVWILSLGLDSSLLLTDPGGRRELHPWAPLVHMGDMDEVPSFLLPLWPTIWEIKHWMDRKKNFPLFASHKNKV